jgi:hypothetical protein
MKCRDCLLTFVFSALSVGAVAQCSNSKLKPVWYADKSQFLCVDAGNSDVRQKDENIQLVGDKASCASARDNLQAVCPQSSEGKACRNEAKSLYNACTQRAKNDNDSQRGSLSSASPATKTDSATCMANFTQQQQACNLRRMPPPVPGQVNPPDTCMQDAVAAQNRCLANSH